MEKLFQILHQNYWLSQLIIVILLTFITHRIAANIISKLQKRFSKKKNIWHYSITRAIKAPILYAIIIFGFSFLVDVLAHINEQVKILSYSHIVRVITTILTITLISTRFINKSEEIFIKNQLKDDSKFDRASIDAICKILKILVYVTAGLIILQTLGFKISGFLALGGVGGIAIGFAAKDLLSNFFGGLMIYFDRPFQVGDWIRSPDKEIEGTVVKIGWRQTQVKTFDHRPLYIPNSVFSSIVVQNPSRMTNRRIHETIGVRYEDVHKLDKIITDVTNYLRNNPEIDQNQTMIVNVNKFAASSIDFFIYAATITTNWVKYHGVKQEILLNIAKIIEENNAEIAFPTSTLHINKAHLQDKPLEL